MPVTVRWGIAAVLFLIAIGCGYLAIAAREVPPDAWWAYWFIYAAVALPCVIGALWLILAKQPNK
jgi:hypothetical protein